MLYVITSSVVDGRIIRRSFSESEIMQELEQLKANIIYNEEYTLVEIPDNTTYAIISGDEILSEYATLDKAQEILDKYLGEDNGEEYRIEKMMHKELPADEELYSDWAD